MADEVTKTANQILEGGAQDAANQQAQGGAEQSDIISDAGVAQKETEGLKAGIVAEQKRRQEEQQKREEAEARARAAEEQLKLLRYQAQTMQTQYQIPQQPDPEQYVQVKDLQQREAQLMQAMQIQTLRVQHQDLDTVIGAGQGMTFEPSDSLKKVIQQNPYLTGIDHQIRLGNPNAMAIAYQMSKQQKELDDLRAAQTASLERANLNKSDAITSPLSPAAVGGSGGISMMSQIPETNTPEFDKFWNDVKNGKYDPVRS